MLQFYAYYFFITIIHKRFSYVFYIIFCLSLISSNVEASGYPANKHGKTGKVPKWIKQATHLTEKSKLSSHVVVIPTPTTAPTDKKPSLPAANLTITDENFPSLGVLGAKKKSN